MARTGLVFYYDYCKNPDTELYITVGNNAFPQLQRKNSHMVFIRCTVFCDYISLMFFVMIPERGQSVIIVQRLPGSQYKMCVPHLDNISDKQNCGLKDSNLQ